MRAGLHPPARILSRTPPAREPPSRFNQTRSRSSCKIKLCIAGGEGRVSKNRESVMNRRTFLQSATVLSGSLLALGVSHTDAAATARIDVPVVDRLVVREIT